MAGKEIILRVMDANGVPRDLSVDISEAGMGILGVKDQSTIDQLERLYDMLQTGSQSQVDAVQALVLAIGRQTGAATANNRYGITANQVPQGEEAQIVHYTLPSAMAFRGFVATGDTDGKFIVRIGGVMRYFGRCNIMVPVYEQELPSGEFVAQGTQITLSVVNEGLGSGRFEGTLLIDQ